MDLLKIIIIGEIVLHIIAATTISDINLEVFNPLRNYKCWTKANWLGVIIGTLLLHVIFPIFAIIYWIYILLTIGRK